MTKRDGTASQTRLFSKVLRPNAAVLMLFQKSSDLFHCTLVRSIRSQAILLRQKYNILALIPRETAKIGWIKTDALR